MIINWMATKAQQFLPVPDTGLDELSVNFDFPLSAEIMDLLYAQNGDCMDTEGRIAFGTAIESNEGAVAGESQQVESAEVAVMSGFALDEHELALA
jgi:hypothetical protein